MALPIGYSLRNVTVRHSSAALTALGIALTVAVFAGVLSLRSGLAQVYRPRGETDVAIYLRLGATSEGESGISRENAQILVKERPEVLRDAKGQPLAAAETYLAVYMEKLGGGLTNVPLRGIQPASLEIYGDHARIAKGKGRWFRFGTDEVVVGAPLTRRMKHCEIGDTLQLNTVPFKVVGIYEHDGAQASEVWGDAERMMVALQRPFYQRVIARVKPRTDIPALAKKLEDDPRTPVKVESERAYLTKQMGALGAVFLFLSVFLTAVMGIAAVLGAMNTMLAAVSSRTHEIGVLLAIGFRRSAIFLAFMLESAFIGLIGGVIGALIILPFNGVETGAMNWNTFTDVSFAFHVTPGLLGSAVGIALLLGVIGGTLPALRACMLEPVDALHKV